MIWTTLRLIIIAIETVLMGMVAYLLLLTAAAFRAGRTREDRRHSAAAGGRPTPTRTSSELQFEPRSNRFLIVIPAHNEERLLPMLLKLLALLDYPQSLYDVVVVADNCTDSTAELARKHGAHVYERYNETERGKGYALREFFQKMHDEDMAHDAVVILDADSIVSANFLSAMDARLQNGERVIQAYYSVRHPSSSWPTALRSIALALLHYLRPLGRMVLGASAGLKGNGMVFSADVLREYQWSPALTEDIEFHMSLILNGERVTFAPDAVVSAEMPETLAASDSQHERWERGRLQMVRRYVPQLLRAARRPQQGTIRRSRFVLLDAVMEHLIPPFSILATASGLSLLGALLLPQAGASRGVIRRRTLSLKGFSVLLGALLLVGQGIYTVCGLYLARVPAQVWTALFYAPLMLLWKAQLYLRILFRRGNGAWIRTRRNNNHLQEMPT